MTVMSMVATIMSPSVGILVDKFCIKKLLFLTTTFLIGVSAVFFLILPKIPIDTTVQFKCDAKTTLTVYSESVQRNLENGTTFNGHNADEMITCQVKYV